MSTPPPVSVLLAVYNGGPYLRAAVESVLTQTFTDFEFIIIDDGSKDDSLKTLREFESRDPRVRLVSRPNKGLTVTLNEGLDLARGEFLARMDADDLCMPERFARQVDYLRAHPECVLLGTRVLLVDPEGAPIQEKTGIEPEHDKIDAAHLNRGWPVVHPTVMMRTAAVRQVGGYRDQYNTLEDLDLFLRLAEVGKLANLPDVLLHYRQHFGSVTHSKAAKQREIRQAIYDETYERRKLPKPTEPPPPMRMTERSKQEQHALWAFAALEAGHLPTARKHAFRALAKAPFWKGSWRAVMCAVRGW